MKQSTLLQFHGDQVILEQGSTSRVLYKIVSGSVAVYLQYGQPDEYLVGILSQQSCFGEITLLCGKPSIYTIVAVEDVLLMRVTEDDFDEFIRNNSQNAIDIMRSLASTLVTLSFNLGQLTEEMSSQNKLDPQQLERIRARLRQGTRLEGDSNSHFFLHI